MSLYRVGQIAAASVPVPPMGKFYMFLDTDNVWKWKDDAGVVRLIGDGDSLSWSVSGSRNTTINSDLDMRKEDGTAYNQSPFIVPVSCELKYITSASNTADTWEAHVYKNGASVANITSTAEAKKISGVLTVAFAAGDEVRLRVQNITGNVSRPSINAIFKQV